MARFSFTDKGRPFMKACAGLAATEFALFAPILIFLFFAAVEGSSALAVARRVGLATNTLADLASQESKLTASQLDDLFEGVEQIVGQGDIDATIRIASLIRDPDTDDVVVHWSRDNAGAEPYAPGTPYPSLADETLLDATSSLVVAELSYSYVPTLTKALIPYVDFNRIATRWPRRSTRVQFCTAGGVCTQ
jgi:hypothetical protein